MRSGLFKILLAHYLFANNICLIHIHMGKKDLALNNLQGLIYHKTQTT